MQEPAPAPRLLSLRGLHSFSGIFPLAVFTAGHTAGTCLTAGDPAAFDEGVDGWYAIPGQPFVSYGVVLLPLAFHALLGMVLAFEDSAAAPPSPYSPAWRRAVAWSGVAAFAFVALHLAQLRFLPRHEVVPVLGGSPHALVRDQFAAAAWIPAAHALGVAGTILHLCAGSWGFLVRFRLVVAPGARRAAAAAAAVLGAALLAAAGAGILRFAREGP